MVKMGFVFKILILIFILFLILTAGQDGSAGQAFS